MAVRDYSKNKYAQICATLEKANYTSITLNDFIQQKQLSLRDMVVVLRHDVDRAAITALRLAQVEASLGLKATYYFRVPGTWNKGIVSKIQSLGHEVGLHYECVDKAHGNLAKAVEILKQDLTIFRAVAEVKTVAMHGNPTTPYNNLDVWNLIRPEDLDLQGEAYLSVDFEKVLYYSDTGRNWTEGKDSLLDNIPSQKKRISTKVQASDTDSLLQIIRQEDRNFYILTHPERWPGTKLGWWLSAAKDSAVNPLKRMFQAGYNLKS